MKLGLLAVALAAAVLHPQSQQPTFRSSTSVVPLSVSVLDRQGLPVTDLTASDFTVFEDNSRREVVAFLSGRAGAQGRCRRAGRQD